MTDKLDKDIMEFLRTDARTPFVEIAQKLNVSEGTIRSRVRRLTEDGTIRGFTIKTSSKNVKALVEVRINVDTDTGDFAKQLSQIYGVTEVFEVTGDQDIIAIIDVESSQTLNDIVEKVRHNDSVSSTRTHVILKEHYGAI